MDERQYYGILPSLDEIGYPQPPARVMPTPIVLIEILAEREMLLQAEGPGSQWSGRTSIDSHLGVLRQRWFEGAAGEGLEHAEPLEHDFVLGRFSSMT